MTRIPPLAIICALLSSACWGVGVVASKFALGFLPPGNLLLLQLVISTIFIGALSVQQSTAWPGRLLILAALATGILEFGIAFGIETYGLLFTTASNAVIITICEPFFVLLLAGLLLREPITRPIIVCGCLALVGLILVVVPDIRAAAGASIGGDLLLVLAAFCAGIYVVSSRRLVATIHPLSLCTLQLIGGSVFVALMLWLGHSAGWVDAVVPISLAGLGIAIIAGLLQFALPFWLHLVALRHMPANIFSFFLTLIPVFGVTTAYIWLGERLIGVQILGTVLLIAALLAVTRYHEEPLE
jgi:drug/metabolite transporter (DMT)-like permease